MTLITCLFNILSDKISMHKAPIPKWDDFHQENSIWLLVLWAQLAFGFGFCFLTYLLKRTSSYLDKLWLFRLSYLADVFSKINGVSPSLQVMQWTMFVAKAKIWAFEWKLDFGKLVSVTISVTASQYLKIFLIRLIVTLENVTFLVHCIMKYIHLWTVCITQSSNISQMTSA